MSQSVPVHSITAETMDGQGSARSGIRWYTIAWFWARPLLIALIAALFVRGFVFGAFRIPTPSMERTLLVGDYVIVSKLHYGPRLPQTLKIPFTDRALAGLTLPYLRLPGLGDVGRGDVAVFNYPVEEGTVDERTHYIKRIVALPGDTLAIRDKQIVVNGEPQGEAPTIQQRWIATVAHGQVVPRAKLAELNLGPITVPDRRGGRFSFIATAAVAETVASFEEVASIALQVEPSGVHSMRRRMFPEGAGYSQDQYGPLYIPAAGDTLILTRETWPLYRDLILQHEDNRVRRPTDDVFEINGARTSTYIVQQDYYFVLGDNRDDSSDSRTWGFVPHSHLVGKAAFVYFSWDPERRAVRWDRLFTAVP